MKNFMSIILGDQVLPDGKNIIDSVEDVCIVPSIGGEITTSKIGRVKIKNIIFDYRTAQVAVDAITCFIWVFV